MTMEMTFIYVLKLTGAESPSTLTQKQQTIVDEHFEYLKNAFSNGKITLVGRCLEGEFGIVIFHADSENQAKEFMDNDPAVKNGLMATELHPFRIVLMQGRQSPSREG